MSKNLIIFGGGDIGQIAKYYFDTDSGYKPVCFTVDGAYVKESTFEGIPVVAFEELTKQFSPVDNEIFVALSYSQMNKLRAAKYQEAKDKGYKVTSYVSSRCTYLSQYKPGENCFIFEDNTIQPFVKIGNNVTLWSGNHIGHHSIIEDHNFISSHVVISGHCHIESYCFVGVNSTLNHKVRLGAESLIGSGAIITKNTEFQSVWAAPRSTALEKKSFHFKL